MADLVVNNQNISGSSYKDFLLTKDVQSKLSPKYGKIIAEDIEAKYTANSASAYFFLRNARFKTNILWAAGKTNIYAKFSDQLALNGKINYANLKWSAPLLTNRIITGLVGRWMEREEKIQVTAIDPLSVKGKQAQYEQAEMVLYNRQKLEEQQKQSGVPSVPPEQFAPEDQDELEQWALSGSRLPEEIKYETGTNDILDSAGFFDVIKEKLLHDSAECGLVATYVWMDEYGVIHPEWVKPLNTLYSYSEYNDFRDTALRAFVKSMKISEVRRKYGQEFGGKLTEEQIFQLAQSAQEYQRFDKLTWNYEWMLAYIRPYDEWNIECIYYWVKSVDEDGYLMTVTKQNKSTIIERRQQAPQNIDDNQEFVKKDKWNLYKGVYARYSKTILEWGLDNNMIRSQDPKETGDVEFPLSLYMYQNQDMRNVAVPEKIEEPIEQMILTRLKIQQIIATMVPPGATINVDAMQEVELGLAADGKSPINVQKVYEQTGRLYHRGRDAEGNPIPVPIQELTNSGFVNQLNALIQLYEFHYKVLKDELGEDPNLITAAAQPRVTTENVQFSQQQADYSTDYIYNAYTNIIEQTARKIACLLNNSIRFGAQAYQHLMQEQDVKDRNFNTKVKLLPDQYEIQKFEGFLNQQLAASPELSMFLDPFKLMRVAKENTKLAELFYRNAQKRMLRNQQQQQQAAQQQQVQGAQAAAQAKSDGDFKLAQAKTYLEIQIAEAQAKANNETALLTGIMGLYQAQLAIPPELVPLRNAVFQSVQLSLAQENKHTIAEMSMEDAAQNQQQQGQDQGQQEQPQGQPQQQSAMQPTQ